MKRNSACLFTLTILFVLFSYAKSPKKLFHTLDVWNKQMFKDFRKVYPLSAEPIDVVIPCHKKDVSTLNLAIAGIKKYGKNIRRVITVSAERLTQEAEWFDEALYPFTKRDVAYEMFHHDYKKADEYLACANTRIGWIYQQLLKLYAPLVIPNISSNVLILDSDAIFLREVTFIDEHGTTLFNVGSEYNEQYFAYAKRLLPGLSKLHRHYSGITHHMLMQRPIIEDLFELIRSRHAMDPWRALCRCIDLNHKFGSALSEYEIYFNFALQRTAQVKIRALKWKDMIFNEQAIAKSQRDGFHYVACHRWLEG